MGLRSESTELSSRLRWIAISAGALGLALACGPAVPDDNSWDETDFSQAELAYPGEEGTPRRGLIDVNGIETVVDLLEIDGALVLDGDVIMPLEMVTLLEQRDENESNVELGETS